MSKMTKELKDKTVDDLKKMLEKEEKILRDFNFGIAGARGKNTMTARDTKRKIARILTQINTLANK